MKHFLFILLFFAVFDSYGQSPGFRQYSIDDGLSDVREIGSSFVNDSVFVSLMGGKMYFFDGRKFIRTSDLKSKYFSSDMNALQDGIILHDSDSQFWYKRFTGVWKKIGKNKFSFAFENTLYGLDSVKIYVFDEDKVKWKVLRHLPKSLKNKKYAFTVFIDADKKEHLGLISHDCKKIYDIENDTISDNGDGFLYVGKVQDKPLYYRPENGEIKWDYCDNIIIPSIHFNEEVYVYLGNTQRQKTTTTSLVIGEGNKKHFFTLDTFCNLEYSGTLDLAAAKISKINNNMFFITSFGGVYKVNPFVSYFSKANSGISSNISTILTHNKSIYLGSYGYGIWKQGHTGFVPVKYKYNNESRKNVLPGGFSYNDNYSWFFTEGDKPILILKDNELQGYNTIINGNKKRVPGYYIDTLNNGDIALGLNKHGLGIVDSIIDEDVYMHTIDKSRGNNLINVLTFVQDINDRIWMGRYSTGIAIYDTKKDTAVTFAYDKEDQSSFGALSMVLDSFDQLWLGTNHGLFVLPSASSFDIYNDNIFDKAIHVCLPNDDNSTVLGLKIAKNYIVAGNISALNFIPNKKYSGDFQNEPIYQLVFGEDINGKGVQQNGMYYDDKRYLWVATIEGLLRLDMNAISFDSTKSEIVIDNIRNGGEAVQISDNMVELAPEKRNLFVSFKQKHNPAFLNNVYYTYVLTNSKDDTIAYQFRKTNNKLRIDYLNPGKYRLSIKAIKNGVLNSEKNLIVAVPYLFWENPWIRTVLISLFLIGLAVYFFYRKEVVKRKGKLKLKLAKIKNEKEKLKVQAIISSFNPHFINNSLHWIQSRYYKDKDMVKMVGRLSENINYIFNKTKQGKAVHSLSEEMHVVDNYVAVQQIRFQNTFEYIKPSKAKLERFKHVDLIVMQIQIHAENAIEHGIRNRKESKLLEITIDEDKTYYYISITDDGIGRNKVKEMTINKNSAGVKMLNELHRIFNNNDENKLKLKSIYEDDIFEENGIKYGTRVKITIPKQFKYII